MLFAQNKLNMLFSHFILILVLTLRLTPCFVVADEISEYNDYEEEDVLDEPEEDNDDLTKRESRSNGLFENQFVGTNLLGPRGLHRKCFTPEDEELLAARMAFEVLLPRINSTFSLENDQSVRSMLQYFYGITKIADKFSLPNSKSASRQALSDLIGGYLNYFYVPLVKLSFYGGNLEYSNAMAVLQLETKCKRVMNTNGNGWRSPRSEWFKPSRVRVNALNQSIGDNFDIDHPPCMNLILSEEDDDADSPNRMLVALPRLEFANEPVLGNVWLPFRRKHNFNLADKSSAFILLRYYIAVRKCYSFKTASVKKFHRRLADWLSDRILPHIEDDQFYPGLGAVLRIMETLQSQGKRAVVRSEEHLAITEEAAKSKDFEQIEHQVDKIVQERKKPGFFENFLLSTSLKNDEQNRGSRLLGITIVAAMFCICIVMLMACCCVARRKAGKPSTEEHKKNNSPRRKFRFRWPFCRRHQGAEDEVECAPDSPSVMSRSREASLSVTHLNVAESRDRLERASSRMNVNSKLPSKRSATKVTKPCSFTASQKRRLNSSKQSPYRTNEIDSFRLNLSATSADSLSADPKSNGAPSDSQSTSRKTRIPVLMQSKATTNDAQSIEPKVKQRFKQPKMVNFPRRHESFTPITYCTKRTMKGLPQHSSWETIPSEKR